MNGKSNALSLIVLSLAAARTVHADAVKDFSTGSSVRVDGATVVVNAPRTASASRPIAKAKDTLDFTLSAELVGIQLPIAINFRGTALGGGWIQYEIDDTYPKPIDLGEGHYLSRIEGRVFMRAAPIRGSEAQTYGNTRLALAGMSYVVAHGDWGTMMVPITELDVRGGVPQPALSRFADPGGLVCSDPEKTKHHTFAITLAGEAKGSGAYVELKEPYKAGIHLPPGVVIHAGKQSANVTAFIEPGFVGTARLTASAGGVVQSLDVVVHPSGDCERR